MFDLEEYLSSIFNKQTIENVLDLWAGSWRYSIYVASYGSKVLAVDNRKMKWYIYPQFLENHPKISFFEDDILHFLHGHHDKYDLILLFNVIVFLNKTEFLSMLPKVFEMLKPGWILSVSFFFADDETMSQNKELSFYNFNDFILPSWFSITRTENELVEEAHKPYWLHTHHIGYIEIKCNQ